MPKNRAPNPNRERAQSLARDLAAMSDSDRAALAARLPVVLSVTGAPISGHNAAFASLQCPDVTMVGGFRQWQAAGRTVMAGSKALYIFAPTSVRTGDQGGSECRFIMVPVFDVSQTEPAAADAAVAA